MPYGGAPVSPPPQNNLVLAILATVLCCLPGGIYAIIQANKVNTLWAQGDQAERTLQRPRPRSGRSSRPSRGLSSE